MSTAHSPKLSDGLKSLAVKFDKFNGIADNESLLMTGEAGRACLALLRNLLHLALIQERELGALRMLVGDQIIPTEVPSDVTTSHDGKVIHPNFGGKQ